MPSAKREEIPQDFYGTEVMIERPWTADEARARQTGNARLSPPPPPKKIAEDVPRSIIHSCSRKVLLKCKTDPFKF
jgi:hypothetical protein